MLFDDGAEVFLGINRLDTLSLPVEIGLDESQQRLHRRPFEDIPPAWVVDHVIDYSLSGDVWSWKYGLDWMPVEGMRFRAMVQRAVRAPNIDELFRAPVEFIDPLLGGFGDECGASRDPIGNGIAELCVAQGVPADQIGIFEAASPFPATVFTDGGNSQLEPEEADTYTIGIVIQPTAVAGLSVAVDYYDIEISNSIGGVPQLGALELCFDSNDADSVFCQQIVRGPSGDIVQLTNPQFNLALSRATGQQDTPTADFIDCAGYFFGLCTGPGGPVVPKFRSNTRATWYSGPLSVSLAWEWIDALDSHIDVLNMQVGTSLVSALRSVGAQSYVDLSLSYQLSERIELYGGVSNLFENDPPLLGAGQTQSNTAPELYDVFGRRFFLGFRASYF